MKAVSLYLEKGQSWKPLRPTDRQHSPLLGNRMAEWHTGRLPYCVYLLSINTNSLVSCGVASVNSTY